jgi:hypothetical protein
MTDEIRSETGPTEGTLRIYPDLLLGTSYLLLRPFFRQIDPDSHDPLSPSNWVFDPNSPEFPGLVGGKGGRFLQRFTNETHPHLRLDTALLSAPRVLPGDMVFWHSGTFAIQPMQSSEIAALTCHRKDLIHSVEDKHEGTQDSSVIYIPAVPVTEANVAYVAQQREAFEAGKGPPHFFGAKERGFVGLATEADIPGIAGRRAMGLEPFEVTENMSPGEREIIGWANGLLHDIPAS